ncbi:helix-turn-helix domain-containing protein [Paracoccus sp. p4-l81]|uniref:helix-turn-helix domain-containing protein n=1 Tax=unclassified Paracoccus (in: a-proteobacteria) TaxID=2688777 RepID=UPI0035B78A6F
MAVSLGDKLRRARKQKGMIMQQVADATGLSVGFISQIERDIAAPSLASLAAIARVLEVSPSQLLGGATHQGFAPMRGSMAGAINGSGIQALTREMGEGHLTAAVQIAQPGQRHRVDHCPGDVLLIVVEGSLVVDAGEMRHPLACGETLHFGASHGFSTLNPGPGITRVIWCATRTGAAIGTPS